LKQQDYYIIYMKGFITTTES